MKQVHEERQIGRFTVSWGISGTWDLLPGVCFNRSLRYIGIGFLPFYVSIDWLGG